MMPGYFFWYRECFWIEQYLKRPLGFAQTLVVFPAPRSNRAAIVVPQMGLRIVPRPREILEPKVREGWPKARTLKDVESF